MPAKMRKTIISDASFVQVSFEDENPGRAPRSDHISTGCWDLHRQKIEEQYQKMTLKELMKHMKDEHGFSATTKQYTTKLSQWGCRKYKVASKSDIVAEHDIPVQHMSYTSEGVSPAPQIDHYSRDEDVALVESPTESCDAGILLNPEHEDIAGRMDDVDSNLMAARESIAVADSNKPLGDEQLPYTGDEPAYGHDTLHNSPETTHAERPMSMLSRYEQSSTEDSSFRDLASIASMSSIQETSNTSNSSTPTSAEASGTQAPPSTQAEYPSVMELDESSYPASSRNTGWSTMISADPDIDMMTPENGHTPVYGNTDYLPSKPNLVDVAPPTGRVSVNQLLRAAKSDNLFRKLQDRDLRKIELLADLFEAAQAFGDAYKLRRLVLLQAIHLYEQDRSSENPWSYRVAHVLKDATPSKDSEEALKFYRKALSADPSLEDDMSQIGMLQQSYASSLYLEWDSDCSHHLRRALQRSKLHPTQAVRPTSQFTLATQLTAFASLKIKQKTSLAPTYGSTYEWVSSSIDFEPGGMESQLWSDRHISSWLLPIFEWCVDVLGKHELLQMLATAPEELWGSSPCAQELERFEIMFVACYLWKQARHNASSSGLNTRAARSEAIFGFAHSSGLSPGVILSVIARMLVSSPDRDRDPTSSKSKLERRLLLTASDSTGFHSKHDLRNGKAFVEAYTATLHDRGTPFSTKEYGRLIEKAVRDFAEQTFNLELEVSELGDPQLCQRHSTSSQALSLLPSMCSTPRSSTSSMYRIFKDTARRASAMMMNNSIGSSMSINSDNDNSSRWSSFDPRRYSKASTKSAGTVESITSSLHDLIMEDSNYI